MKKPSTEALMLQKLLASYPPTDRDFIQQEVGFLFKWLSEDARRSIALASVGLSIAEAG